ncbi:MAG: hypothetical protein COV75_04765 [Candidatus Omnitrophica bacterium CG11_big_fil_rev_8_21_14_0_20_63_9]|nr:MAG: hypothetical protein COV75_04765 [Candidatus Omnitrophica bacterium CG11_big_fil_rev_8_21_14_0_20_63_9]
MAIKRTAHVLLPDPRRVIAKAYLPGEEIAPGGLPRAALLMERVLKIPEPEVASALAGVLRGFSQRHKGFEQILERNFEKTKHYILPGAQLSHDRRLLIGAYFTHEYSVEASALFNPSMVLAPDQTNLQPGHRRFVMSLRAVGEGHISSIEFRSGTLSAASEVAFDPVGPRLVNAERAAATNYDKGRFAADLNELGAGNRITQSVLSQLPEQFSIKDLERSLGSLEKSGPVGPLVYQTAKTIRALALSNYVTSFPADSALSERVIFPCGPYETRGMEDARFVRFIDDDGSVKYYATYTAFNGFEIAPQLIETDDFMSFKIRTLSGVAAQNKGMALFPRRIDGKYVMLSRMDHENLHLAASERLRFWDDIADLRRPSQPWELVQIGNCGSPLETKAGWLVLTHGVGPMRRYTLSALLLDLADPRRVIGHLPIPLLEPDETEREGYVPNVLYSCGSLINGDTLVLPYGFADYGIKIALISMPELLAKLQRSAA